MALGSENGEILWESVKIKGNFGPSIAEDGKLYVTGVGGGRARLYVLDPLNPLNPFWSRESTSFSLPLISQDFVFIVENSVIRVYDFEGTEIWNWEIQPTIFSKNLVLTLNGTLLIPGQKLMAVLP